MKLTLKNLERLSAVLFVLFLPIQTRLFLFGASTPSEWSSAFLYASDLLFIALLVVFGARVFQKQVSLQNNSVVWVVGLFVIFSFISVLFAEHISVASFGALKALQGGILFVWAYSTDISRRCIVIPLVIGGVVNALVGFFQFSFQKSIGLTFLAESPLAPYTDQVAEIVVSSGRFIRAYGLVPSPNVLAFFLVVALLLLVALYYRKRIEFIGSFVFGAFVLILTLVLSFSRGIMLAGAGVVLYYFSSLIWSVQGEYKKRAVEILVLVGVCAVVVGVIFSSLLYDRFFVNIGLDNAVQERLELNSVAMQNIQSNPLGVGAKHFTLATDQEFPVHNVFLLVAAEIGVIGGVLFVLILLLVLYSFFQSLKQSGFSEQKLLWFSVVVLIILTALIDHFLFTLQQGMLAFWLLIGVATGVFRDKR